MATGDSTQDIGGARYVAIGKPATEDQTGWAALEWVRWRGVVTMPESGDTFEEAGQATLDDGGRMEHIGGGVDGGTISIPFKTIAGDLGQAVIHANFDGCTPLSFQDVDEDGEARFFHGVIMGLQRRGKERTSQKGYSVSIGINSAQFIGVEAPAV